MKPKKKKSGIRLRIAIILSLGFISLIVGLLSYINDPRLQSIIYTSINKVSSFKIESADVKLNLVERKLDAANLNIYNCKKNQRFTADRVAVDFKILPLFKGTLKIKRLAVQNLKIDIGRRIKFITERGKGIGLARLLILKNMTIQDGYIINVRAGTPEWAVETERIDFSFAPSIFGKAKLDAVLSGLTFLKGSEKKEIDIKSLSIGIDYSGEKLNIESSKIAFKDGTIEIDGEINRNNQKYSLEINVPQPIYLPLLARETSFIDTSGNFSGKIIVKGKGLNYKATEGTAKFDITHQLSGKDALPSSLNGELKIADGKISILDATLKIGDSTVKPHGSFNYIAPHLELSFEGANIPVETVTHRFQNKKFHPINGIARVSGKVTGWKPDIKFLLDVDASPASYYDIVVERAVLDLDMTYHSLQMKGFIYQGGRAASNVDLDMKMGEKLPNGKRHKTLELKARVNGHNLAPSMEGYGLKGIGSGELVLSGVNNTYNGSGKATIEEGSLFGIEFTSAKSDIKLSTKKVLFENVSIGIKDVNPLTFASPVVLEIFDYGMRLTARPRTGIEADVRRLSDTGLWIIDKITYSSEKNHEWTTRASGTVSKGGALNIRLDGRFDTSLLSYLRGFIKEAEGPVDIKNIVVSGTSSNISVTGTVSLHDNTFQPKGWGYYFDNVSGDIVFGGRTINAKEITGRIEYGDFKLSGQLTHANNKINHADISFNGKSVLYATPDRSFRMEFNCDLALKGNPYSSLFSGDINIIDGRYTKKFSIFETLKRTAEYEDTSPKTERWRNMNLDLKVKTKGDLKIDNNIGEIWLNADLMIRGTRSKPLTSGNIEAQGGKIRYAGLDFEVTRGYVELREPYTNPYIEFVTSKEVGRYNINLTVKGRTDKLFVDFESTPPLDKKDILALLTFGTTGEDMRQTRFGYQMGTGFVAEQVGAVLQKPVSKFTPIDRFRLEASPRANGNNITRVHMGKDISDRLKVNFVTDINAEDAQQTFQAEYLLTDFMLLKGERMSGNNYRFHLSFRFRE